MISLWNSTHNTQQQMQSHHLLTPSSYSLHSSAAAATSTTATGTVYPRRVPSHVAAVALSVQRAAIRKTNDRSTIKAATRSSRFTSRSTWVASRGASFAYRCFPSPAPSCQSSSPRTLIERNMSKWLKFRFSSCH